MSSTETKDFETALRTVIDELKAPKGQKNNFGNYKYRSAEDILEAVKPLLTKNGLRLKISDKMVVLGDRYYVEASVTVKGYGEEDTVTAYAREADSKKGMDDSQVTGATSSYARKYALNGMFDIDDTKDADSDEHTQQRQTPKTAQTKPRPQPENFVSATEEQKREITILLTKEGIMVSQIPDVLAENYDHPQGEPMSFDKAKEIIASLKKEPF